MTPKLVEEARRHLKKKTPSGDMEEVRGNVERNSSGIETVLFVHPLPQLVHLIQVQAHLVLMCRSQGVSEGMRKGGTL